mmetsp:Transcript_6460/g.17869  ORF Transcript_6460/g.17869 Transcript_6460/m.17869 type:complete len:206 (-) Transcript_6460:2389-3006(-)
MPAARSSRFFWSDASRRASSNCFSRAFRLAFFPFVFANLARASDNISFSSSSISTASGLAGLLSGWGSISPGRNLLASFTSSSIPDAISNNRSYRSKHCVAVRPTMGAIVRHCVGISLARCNSFSSSSRVHSVFLIAGSSHSYHRALHCLADLRFSRDAIRAQLLSPYFITPALRISSSVFFQTPPLITIFMMPAARQYPTHHPR